MKIICPILNINYFLTFCFAREIGLNDHLKLAKCNFFSSFPPYWFSSSVNEPAPCKEPSLAFVLKVLRPKSKHAKVWAGQTFCTHLDSMHEAETKQPC